jgi:hypothetical protein
MQKHELKTLIASGHYRPQPADVAQAMLRRRAVRDLLIGAPAASNGNGNGKLRLNPADRMQSPSAAPRQAA